MRSIRYQLLSSTIDKRPYIPPITTDSDYGGFLTIGETLITDDPHHCTMGWLSEIGKQALIKLTDAQVNALYDHMYVSIYGSWYTYVSNDRKGYKFGLVATVDYPMVLRNYDWSWLPSPKLISVDHGIAVIALESWFRYAGITKYSRTKADVYEITLLTYDRNGRLLDKAEFKAYHNAKGDYVKLDYEPAYY